MKINIESSEARAKRLSEVHKWFAWYPVWVSNTQIIWLEYVGRKLIPVGDSYAGLWAYYKIK